MLLALTVELGELLPVCVEEGLGVLLGLWLGVTELLSETLPVVEAEAPAVREAVGDADTVLLELCVEEGVTADVPVAL